ncbi:MAG: septum site-determining protein MinC [Thermacetogeniaceae bacterium]
MDEIVKIKGTSEGLTVLLEEAADFQALLQRLEERIAESNGFLVGSAVSIDIGPRDLQLGQLASLGEILAGHNMVLRRIIAGPRSHGTLTDDQQGVKIMGQEAAQARPAGHKKRRRKRGRPSGEMAAAEASATTEAAGGAGTDIQDNRRQDKDDIPVIRYSLAAGAPRADMVSEEQTIMVQRTIRSGQRVFYPGNVVVLGDVNPGGEIVSGGNIIVMGAFRGVAHAGAMGDKKAIVAALRLEPSQLRIAGYITRAPEGDFSTLRQPEIARVQDGVVIIEQYQTGFDRN